MIRPRDAGRTAPTTVEAGLDAGHSWTPPPRTGPLKKRFGASILDDFVRGHSAADVFREIVQNEYDGQGSAIEILFGQDELQITGSGRPIPRNGWKRLSVIAGTGDVVGDDDGDYIEPKANGIGSKNFGIRSLFYFGDEVRIRSNGRFALLDFKELGTDSAADPSSAGRLGVSIHIPYRTELTRKVEPFTAIREARAMDQISEALLPTLVKLAGAGKAPGVRSLRASSVRTGRRLIWSQTAKADACAVKGVAALRRSGKLQEWSAGASEATVTRIEEIEFSRTISIPPEHQGLDYPAYFRAGPTSLRVAVSLPLVRNRIDLDRIGHFYYPLQTPQSRTGSVVSVSAPFNLDNDRSSLLDTEWNAWLCGEAAALAQVLLQGDWFDRFGPDAYLAVAPTGPATPDVFNAAMHSHLETAPCWPTREVIKRTRTYAKVIEIVVPADPLLDGFMGDKRYFDARMLKNPAAKALAITSGAKAFTLASLVKLRCHADGGAVTTAVPATEADFVYRPYAETLLSPETQIRSAEVLTTLGRYLTPANRTDLRDTPSTLSADGRLAPAHTLTRVEDFNWDDCPESVGNRLDRRLNDARAIARHCKPFDLGRWVEDACERAASGVIEDGERQAVYHWLLQPQVKMTPRLLAAVRRSPVVRDSSGQWCAPVDLAVLPRRDANDLKPVARAPSPDLAKRSDLLERLKIRRKVAASDLIALAGAVQDRPGLASVLETVLGRHASLLRASDWTTLSATPCLLSRAGTPAEPRALHIATPSNLEWLDDDRLIVAGAARDLHRRLGCRSEPQAKTLLDVLDARRSQNAPPPRAEEFYPALVDALRRESVAMAAYVDRPLLYIDRQYRSPADALVYSTSTRIFAGAVPVFRGSETLARAFQALGLQTQAQTHHWIALFRWFEGRAEANQGRLSSPDQTLIRAAYRQRAFLPKMEWPNDLKFLLGSGGRLHSLADVAANRLVENDYPALAAALQAAGAAVDFIDGSEEARSYLYRFSIRRLTEICGTPTVIRGAAAPARPWLGQACVERLTLLHRPDFAVALAELGHAQRLLDASFRPAIASRIASKLTAIRRIEIVDSVRTRYTVAGRTVTVQADAALSEDAIALIAPRGHVEFDQIFAATLAEVVGATTLKDVRAMSLLIASLLRCRSVADVRSFLTRQGIPLPAAFRGEDDGAPDDLFAADERLEDAIRNIMGGLDTAPAPSTPPPLPPPSPPPPHVPATPPPVRTPAPLPPLEGVTLTVSPATGDAPAAAPIVPGRGGGGGGGWSPPTPEDTARDRMVGERGEELVYREELRRVAAMGHERPEDVVIWTSRTQPGADHDIRSLDENGQVLWIEVKATTGSDGRFEWSRAEFEKAMREGARYELVRVYEANTASPTAVRFRNPAALQGGRLRIELNSLRAFVQSRG